MLIIRFAITIVALLLHLILNQSLNVKLIVAFGDRQLFNLTFITHKLGFQSEFSFTFEINGARHLSAKMTN